MISNQDHKIQSFSKSQQVLGKPRKQPHFIEAEGPLREYVVAQLVEALRYKPEGCGFDSRCGQWDFSLGSTQPVTEVSTRSISWEEKAAEA